MGAYLIKQKNGLLTRYSTCIDDVTHYDMTEEDYINYSIQKAIKQAEQDAKWMLKNQTVDIDYFLSEIININIVSEDPEFTEEELIEMAKTDYKDLKQLIKKGVFGTPKIKIRSDLI